MSKGDKCKIDNCQRLISYSGRVCNFHRHLKSKFGSYDAIHIDRKHPQIKSRNHDSINSRKNLFYSQCRFPNENGCIEWQGSCNSKGYGQISNGKKPILASRFSYALHNGLFDSSLCVLHHCDNPKCVAPNHLFLGTKKDNMQDCIKKGRHNWFKIKEKK